jgi:hypothetical protein
MYKKVDMENLSKGFEGILRLRPTGSWPLVDPVGLTCTVDWSRVFGEEGPLLWTSSYLGSNVIQSLQNFCPLMTFVYNIPDLPELRQICIAQKTQNRCQVKYLFHSYTKGHINKLLKINWPGLACFKKSHFIFNNL